MPGPEGALEGLGQETKRRAPERMLTQVSAREIDAVWEGVDRGLRIILRRCGQGNWKPEDVKRHIETGLAGLFICDAGFLVLERDSEAISQRPFLNVWLAWFRPGFARKHRHELIAWLDAMRAETKSEWWEFRSPREGWIGIEPDCTKVMTIWRRK